MLLGNVQKLDKSTLLSDELFIELFDIPDEIDRQRMIFELQDQAKLLGVKAKFDALLKAFESTLKRESKISGIHYVSDFNYGDKDYPILDTGCWIANDDEIYAATMFGKKIACTHPIFPRLILTNAETGFCKVALVVKIKGKWREICVDKEMIASASKIVELSRYGIRVTSENARALVQYLSDIEALNEDLITEQISTSKLGWINGEFMPYGQNIIFDNEQNLKSLFDSIKPVGSRQKWYDLVLEQRKIGKIEVMINLIASLSSPIIEIVNGLPFVVSLWGETGKGKTVALMLGASVWADPGEGKYLSDAKATSTALELRLNFLNSLPMLLDDMAQVKNQYDGNFSELIYRWCAGKGKERANRNLELNKSTTWKNCIITNAEHSLITSTMQGGAVNRIIDVEMAEGEIFKNGHDVVEVLKSNYGYCGKEFIDIIQNVVGFDGVKEIQKDFYEQIINATKGTEREKEEKQILPMSILLTADKIAEEYLFKDGVRLDFETCVNLLKNKNEVSENERTYQYLVDEIVRNDIKFQHSSDELDRAIVDNWGFIDDEKHQAIIIRTVFNDILKKGGFSDRTFLSWAAKRGIIEVDADGVHKDKRKKIKGTTLRCVFLYLEADCDDFIPLEEIEEELPFM